MRQFILLFSLVSLYFFAACTKEKVKETRHRHTSPVLSSSRSYADSVNSGIIPKDTLKGSPMRMAMNTVGNNHVHIEYASPGVKGRIIWGGLVAYDEVWSAGAHHATTIDLGRAIMVEGKKIEAGKYGFFVIPGEKEWTVIFNKNWDQHLADEYDPKEDVLRTKSKVDTAEVSLPRLTYSVDIVSEEEGKIVLRWEKIVLTVPFRNAI